MCSNKSDIHDFNFIPKKSNQSVFIIADVKHNSIIAYYISFRKYPNYFITIYIFNNFNFLVPFFQFLFRVRIFAPK